MGEVGREVDPGGAKASLDEHDTMGMNCGSVKSTQEQRGSSSHRRTMFVIVLLPG